MRSEISFEQESIKDWEMQRLSLDDSKPEGLSDTNPYGTKDVNDNWKEKVTVSFPPDNEDESEKEVYDYQESLPSRISELIRGGQKYDDPYENFIDDIKGWEEQTEEDLLSVLASTVSYRYIAVDEKPATPPGDEKILVSLMTKKKRRTATAIHRKDIDTTGVVRAHPEYTFANTKNDDESEEIFYPPPQSIDETRPLVIVHEQDGSDLHREPILHQDLADLATPPKESLRKSEIGQRPSSRRQARLKSASTSRPFTPSPLGIVTGKKYSVESIEALTRKKNSGTPEKSPKTILPQINPSNPSLQECKRGNWIITGQRPYTSSRSPSPPDAKDSIDQARWLLDKKGLDAGNVSIRKTTPKKLSPFGFRPSRVLNPEEFINTPPIIATGKKSVSNWIDVNQLPGTQRMRIPTGF